MMSPPEATSKSRVGKVIHLVWSQDRDLIGKDLLFCKDLFFNQTLVFCLDIFGADLFGKTLVFCKDLFGKLAMLQSVVFFSIPA